MSRGKFIAFGLALSFAHVAMTVWIFSQLPLSMPRGPTPFEQFLQYLLVVLHPTIGINRWLIPLPPAIAVVAFFAETFLSGFGTAWAIGWVRRTLARQGGH